MRFWPLLFLFLHSSLSQAGVVSRLRESFSQCTEFLGGRQWLVTRSYLESGAPKVLAFDPSTLDSKVFSPAALKCSPGGVEPLTRLGQALNLSTEPPFPLTNDGTIHAHRPVEGFFLTVDLCPTSHPSMDQDLIDALVVYGQKSGRPVDVAFAVSGNWIIGHPSEFASLQRLRQDGKLRITWVNHSMTHPFRGVVPLEKNFLLTPGVDFRREVLGAESELLTRGEVPSPFFRFPGLVSSQKLVAELASLALAPLGSDAWLAKGETPKAGSIILVHGNTNERPGIRRFLSLLAQPGLEFFPLGDLF